MFKFTPNTTLRELLDHVLAGSAAIGLRIGNLAGGEIFDVELIEISQEEIDAISESPTCKYLLSYAERLADRADPRMPVQYVPSQTSLDALPDERGRYVVKVLEQDEPIELWPRTNLMFAAEPAWSTHVKTVKDALTALENGLFPCGTEIMLGSILVRPWRDTTTPTDFCKSYWFERLDNSKTYDLPPEALDVELDEFGAADVPILDTYFAPARRMTSKFRMMTPLRKGV